MASKPPGLFNQSGVVPYIQRDSELEILLITSSRKRWVIPKGVIEPDMTPWDSAAKEAYEEAGVRGAVSTHCLGTFTSPKWGGICQIRVYPMQVQEILEHWPEATVRLRRWMNIEEACAAIDDEALRRILRVTADYVRNGAEPSSQFGNAIDSRAVDEAEATSDKRDPA